MVRPVSPAPSGEILSNLESAYRTANAYLNEGLIRTVARDERPKQPRCQLMQRFLERLGNPQHHYPAVHVAGTSGKGSIALMVAEIARAAGLRVGLHVTPYLQVATEKLWVDGRYVDVEQFSDLVDWVRQYIFPVDQERLPIHGMASLAIALEYFRRCDVDLAVIEVGVGGRHDLTRVVDTKIAIIGSVGRDHLKTLGPTIDDVAWHKAGIIVPGCRAVVLRGAGELAATIQANEMRVPLRVVEADESADSAIDIAEAAGHNVNRICEGFSATRRENARLAIAAIEEIGEIGMNVVVDQAAIEVGLERARLPGRLEMVAPRESVFAGQPAPCPILLDGAHNEDKLNSLCRFIEEQSVTGKIHLVFGQLESKADVGSPTDLARLATDVIVTEPDVYGKVALSARDLSATLEQRCDCGVSVETDPIRAVQRAMRTADAEDLIVVTGSLYLVGNVRTLWHPDWMVLERRSSFGH